MTEYSSSVRQLASGGRVPRATQRFLGVIAHRSVATPIPEKVRIEHEAWQVLLTMLERVGTVRNGPLWGSYMDGLAMVTDAGHGGYASEILSQDNVVALDPSYVLGWSDCLSQYGSNEVDWIGHWVILPQNEITDELAIQESLLGAMNCGILTERHFLVVVGVDAEQVKGRAYRNVQGNAVEIDLTVI